MTDKELFYQRIEEEYKDYVMRLEDKDAEEMMADAEFNGDLKVIYEHLMHENPIDEDGLEYFMKLKKPLQFICEMYQEYKPSIDESLDYTLWQIQDKEMLDYEVNEESGKLVEIMREEYDNNDLHYGGQEHPFAADSLAKAIISEDFCFPEEDAKMLLQFKKPFSVLLDLYTDSRFSTFEDQYPDIMDKLRSMDLLTGPYALKKNAILPETKYRHDIVNRIVELVPEPDYSITARWLAFFREMNIATADDSYVKENPYERFGKAIEAIAYTFGNEVLQRLYELPNKYQPILENELIGAVKYLSNGGNIAEIPQMAENGIFDGFSIAEQQGGMELC